MNSYRNCDRRPVYQEFEANFRDIAYSEKFTKHKALAQYILGGITKHFSSDGIAWERMTIEHLANQSIKPGSSLTDEDVAQIGNLMIVGEQVNAKLKNKSFQEKMKILRSSHVYLDDYLKHAQQWGKKQIEERTNFLAKVAYEEVWSI